MFSKLNKTASFTRWMTPDDLVPTVEAAKEAGDDILRKARPVRGSFTWVTPQYQPETELLAVSPACMQDMGLEQGYETSTEFKDIVSGQTVVEGVYPWAQAYAGWQFGEWVGQLGDGRAISLFEVNSNNKRYELQLKGAGMTPYSRFADGKAVLRSSIREFLGSEAVNALGIPTTRALAITKLPETKARRHRSETCAIVARAAESWIRCGTFDLHRAKGNRNEMRKLADYCIQELFNIPTDANRYENMFREICLRNARGLAHWQAYGLLNGVLNTDNTSVMGLFIDYGPFAFMDTFDGSYSPNHDDGLMRYAYKNVPTALWWNLVRLGEDLGEFLGAGPDLIDDPTFVNEGVKRDQVDGILARAEKTITGMEKEFRQEFIDNYVKLMVKRLGLKQVKDTDHDKLLTPLLDMLEQCQLDYNLFLRRLGDFEFDSSDVSVFFPAQRDFVVDLEPEEAKQKVQEWLEKYKARCEEESLSNEARQAQSRAVNPNFVLKSHILNQVIDSVEKGEKDLLQKVLHMSLNPFNETWGYDADFEKSVTSEPPRGDRDIQCSCSS